MSLKERITEDMKSAMRAKEADRLSTIRMLLAACKQREVDERIVLDDVAVVGLGAAKASLAGKADMALVSAAVKRALTA